MGTLDPSVSTQLDTPGSNIDVAQGQYDDVDVEERDPNNTASNVTRTWQDSPRGSWSTKVFSKDDGHGRYSMPKEDEEDERLLSDRKLSRSNRMRKLDAGIRCRYLILAMVAVVSVAIGFAVSTFMHYSIDHSGDSHTDWGERLTISEGLLRYPTDLLRDVVPIPCHSHNDYWRDVPLFSALHAGFTGVEADVWNFDDDLYVGHNTASLTRNRTFQALYVNPLVELLERQNPTTEFYSGKSHGVFDTESGQSLVLMVDVKTDGATTWPLVSSQLGPLRRRDWLTFVQDGTVHNRPITVVGTGNAPFDLLAANATYRDAFFDAPLDQLWTDLSGSEAAADLPNETGERADAVRAPTADYNKQNSYYASTSFRDAVGIVWFNELSQKQLNIIRGQIKGAHERGLKARYWETPAWPINLRNHVWRVLINEGVDYLNVDDLEGAEKGMW